MVAASASTADGSRNAESAGAPHSAATAGSSTVAGSAWPSAPRPLQHPPRRLGGRRAPNHPPLPRLTHPPYASRRLQPYGRGPSPEGRSGRGWVGGGGGGGWGVGSIVGLFPPVLLRAWSIRPHPPLCWSTDENVVSLRPLSPRMRIRAADRSNLVTGRPVPRLIWPTGGISARGGLDKPGGAVHAQLPAASPARRARLRHV